MTVIVITHNTAITPMQTKHLTKRKVSMVYLAEEHDAEQEIEW